MNKKRFLLEGRDILKLAWPLLVAQITQMLMGVSDTIMAGRYSATDMAAVALGFSITVPLLCFIQGIALALPPNHFTAAGKQKFKWYCRRKSASRLSGFLCGISGSRLNSLY